MPVFLPTIALCSRLPARMGQLFFSKTFTKQNFASLIPDRYLTHSILEGMVFDDEKNFKFQEYHFGCQCQYSNDRFIYSFLYHYYSRWKNDYGER